MNDTEQFIVNHWTRRRFLRTSGRATLLACAFSHLLSRTLFADEMNPGAAGLDATAPGGIDLVIETMIED